MVRGVCAWPNYNLNLQVSACTAPDLVLVADEYIDDGLPALCTGTWYSFSQLAMIKVSILVENT